MPDNGNARPTIFALSSGAPPAAIAIIRISGPQAEAAALALCGTLPDERRAGLRTLIDPVTGEPLDEALLLWFGAERSVTGEQLVELHCHGGRAVVAAVLAVLAGMEGLAVAEPGAFTRRALENGRMDLNAVEGLGDLLRAETETQRRAAMAMYGGAFTARVEEFQRQALASAAFVEAALDLSDEDDVAEDLALAQARAGVASLIAALDVELTMPHAARLRDGLRLVIAGPANSGKSTLLNRLVGWEAAIVTDIAGTTRDRIEVPVSLGGVAWLMTDTAGFRDSKTVDPVERIGINRAVEAIEAADLLLWLGDPADLPREDAVRILPQIDRAGAGLHRTHDVALSAHSGEGMASLMALLEERAGELLARPQPYIVSDRQRAVLEQAVAALRPALDVRDPLLVAEHLRECLNAFDRLTGKASTEHMLDSLFAGFCVGK